MSVNHSRPRVLAHTLALLGLAAPPAVAYGQSTASEPPPISLGQLLDRVRTQHPRVAAAESRVAAALGARRTAGVYPNPILGVGLENATLPGRERTAAMDREVMSSATVPLEFIYQRGARVRRADAELDAARADAFAERQRIGLAAVRTYYRVASSQVEVATAEDLVRWLDSLVAYTRARADEGAASGADLIRAELERDHASNELTIGLAALARARADLVTFTGDSSGATASLAPVVMPDLPLALPPAGIAGARPDVKSAQAHVTAAGAGMGIARSMLVRDVSAMAGLKWSAGTTTLLAGLSLPFPLIDQNRGELARARAERDVAVFELAAMERQVSAELAGARATAALLAERVRALVGPAGAPQVVPGQAVSYLARADEARRITLGAYQEGAVPLFQVLDVARAWGEARLSFYQTLYAQHESVAALLVAQGRDLFTTIPALLADKSQENQEGAR